MDFSMMPEEVLINVLRCASPTTVSIAKRMNKRMHRIVERSNLGRPKVEDFSVEMRTYTQRAREVGRIQLIKSNKIHKRMVVTIKRKEKSRQIVEESEEGPSYEDNLMIGEAMRQVKIIERLSFDGVTVNTAFHSMMTARWNDLSSVHSLSFTLSRMALTEDQMISLLSRTNINSLTLDFCHFDQDIISDKVLVSVPNLQALRIQPRSTKYINQITDRTLTAWKNSPPTTIVLYNCMTHITLQGVAELMKSSFSMIVDWDFGRLLPSEGADSTLFSILSTPGLNVFISDDYRSRRVQISHGLSKIAFNIINEEASTM